MWAPKRRTSLQQVAQFPSFFGSPCPHAFCTVASDPYLHRGGDEAQLVAKLQSFLKPQLAL